MTETERKRKKNTNPGAYTQYVEFKFVILPWPEVTE